MLIKQEKSNITTHENEIEVLIEKVKEDNEDEQENFILKE